VTFGWGKSALALDGLQVGMRAPAVSLPDLSGRTVSTANFPDATAIVVVFWAAWSEYAPELLERLERMHRAAKDGSLVVVGVNVENQRLGPAEIAAAQQVVRQHGITFPTLLDRGLKTFRDYGVMAVPSTVLLDSKHAIRAVLVAYPLAGREEFFEEVEALARGQPPKARATRSGPVPAPKAVRYYNLGRALIGRGMTDEAEANLKKAMEADPKFLFPPLVLARLYRERATTEEAIEFRGERHVTASFQAGRAALLAEAERLLGICLALDPKQPLALLELAQTRLALGDEAGAARHLAAALQADPTLPLARAILGTLELRAGKTAAAQAAFAEARRLNPLDFRIDLSVGEAYADKGMLPQAIASFKRAYQQLRAPEAELFQHSFGR
jgi:tetratricopeptide (TPR) repeat protein